MDIRVDVWRIWSQHHMGVRNGVTDFVLDYPSDRRGLRANCEHEVINCFAAVNCQWRIDKLLAAEPHRFSARPFGWVNFGGFESSANKIRGRL
jgi:hypothetical protein